MAVIAVPRAHCNTPSLHSIRPSEQLKSMSPSPKYTNLEEEDEDYEESDDEAETSAAEASCITEGSTEPSPECLQLVGSLGPFSPTRLMEQTTLASPSSSAGDSSRDTDVDEEDREERWSSPSEHTEAQPAGFKRILMPTQGELGGRRGGVASQWW